MAATVSLTGASLISTAATFAPSLAKSRAADFPMPEPAPVINATLLASFIVVLLFQIPLFPFPVRFPLLGKLPRIILHVLGLRPLFQRRATLRQRLVECHPYPHHRARLARAN